MTSDSHWLVFRFRGRDLPSFWPIFSWNVFKTFFTHSTSYLIKIILRVIFPTVRNNWEVLPSKTNASSTRKSPKLKFSKTGKEPRNAYICHPLELFLNPASWWGRPIGPTKQSRVSPMRSSFHKVLIRVSRPLRSEPMFSLPIFGIESPNVWGRPHLKLWSVFQKLGTVKFDDFISNVIIFKNEICDHIVSFPPFYATTKMVTSGDDRLETEGFFFQALFWNKSNNFGCTKLFPRRNGVCICRNHLTHRQPPSRNTAKNSGRRQSRCYPSGTSFVEL